jgi:hypothetical protein
MSQFNGTNRKGEKGECQRWNDHEVQMKLKDGSSTGATV